MSVVSNSVRPHRQQPTRLPHPWDSPGKNTRVGCHFLLQGMKVKSENEVAQSCPTLSHPMDCSLPGSSVHGIFQARVLEWGAIAFSERWLSTKELMLSNCGARERLWRVPWTVRRSKQPILKEINPEYPLEGLRLMRKPQYCGHLM